MKRGETTNYHVEPPQAVQNMYVAPSSSRQIPGTSNGSPWHYGHGAGNGGRGGGMGRGGRGFHNHVNIATSTFIKTIILIFSYTLTHTQQRQHVNFNNYPPPGTTEDPYKVTLEIGNRSFLGIGNTLQAARHDAASK